MGSQDKRTLFEARGIVKRYGNATALSGLDISLNRGDFVTVFGANGAGKTTFLKIAAALMSPTEGEILLSGKELDRTDSEQRSKIGYIGHDIFMYMSLTARENLRFYASLYDISDADQKIDTMLDSVGLSQRSGSVTRNFSRGMLQRLTIARAFLHNPSLMLLDEPYTGLDTHAAEILNELLRSMDTGDRAGIMTTHNIDQGFDIATHVAILHGGKICFFARTDESDKNEFRARYLELMEEKDRRRA